MSGEPVGWIVLGPTRKSALFGGGLSDDWDATVHQTREDGEEALRECHAAGFDHYRLYAVSPVDGAR